VNDDLPKYTPTMIALLDNIFSCNAAQRLATSSRQGIPAAGGTRLARETEKTQSYEKGHFGGANPAVRVHALLGGVYKASCPYRFLT
jgi:hypothetical protein